MGTNYPDVVPGQTVEYSAQRENDIRHLLNSRNGMGAGAFIGGQDAGSRLKVYNTTTGSLASGRAVSFTNGTIIDGAVPVTQYDTLHPNWGVTIDVIDPYCFGEVVVSGPVEVEIESGSGRFARPSFDGKTFVFDGSGATVLSYKDKKAIILLGGTESSEYNGYFSCKKLSRSEEDINKDQVRVAVCDGATWDAERETSSDSLYYVNGFKKRMPCTIVNVSSMSPYIVLRHIENENKDKIVTVSNPYSHTSGEKSIHEYIIGELAIQSGKIPEITQRHEGRATNGMIYLWPTSDVCSWIYEEPQFDDEDEEEEEE